MFSVHKVRLFDNNFPRSSLGGLELEFSPLGSGFSAKYVVIVSTIMELRNCNSLGVSVFSFPSVLANWSS